ALEVDLDQPERAETRPVAQPADDRRPAVGRDGLQHAAFGVKTMAGCETTSSRHRKKLHRTCASRAKEEPFAVRRKGRIAVARRVGGEPSRTAYHSINRPQVVTPFEDCGFTIRRKTRLTCQLDRVGVSGGLG